MTAIFSKLRLRTNSICPYLSLCAAFFGLQYSSVISLAFRLHETSSACLRPMQVLSCFQAVCPNLHIIQWLIYFVIRMGLVVKLARILSLDC